MFCPRCDGEVDGGVVDVRRDPVSECVECGAKLDYDYDCRGDGIWRELISVEKEPTGSAYCLTCELGLQKDGSCACPVELTEGVAS